MSWRIVKVVSVAALAVSALTLTHHLAWAKGKKPSEGKSFKITGLVKSVDTDKNTITLEQKRHGKRREEIYTLAPNATIKSGSESKSLADLSAGMRVQLQGTIGAGNARTVSKIIILPAKQEKSKGNSTRSGSSAGQSRQGGGGY